MADDMINGYKVRVNVDMVVLAIGMVPNTVDTKIQGLDVDYDELGLTAVWHEETIDVGKYFWFRRNYQGHSAKEGVPLK